MSCYSSRCWSWTRSRAGLLHASISGPQILSGGSFGPEASIFAIAVCAVPTVLFLLLAKRRNRIHTRAALAPAAAR